MERVRRGTALLLAAAMAYGLAVMLANEWRVNRATDSMVPVLAVAGLVAAVAGLTWLILGLWPGGRQNADR